VLELVPLSTDLEAARRLLRAATYATVVPGERPDEVLLSAEDLVRSGGALGGLFSTDGRPVGLALWEPPTPVGLLVYSTYLEPSHATRAAYRDALAEIGRAAGPVAFVLRSFVGLRPEDEAELMRSLGFERYGRSEMRFAASAPVPEVPAPAGVTFRSPVAEDAAALAALNTRAYADGLDRFLFLTDLDAARDSERHVSDVLGGRFGPFLDSASFIAEEGGVVVGACLVVRAPYGPLVVNVMVDPDHQGRKIAQAMLVASLRALRVAREAEPVLNVTEGNTPAVRAYERVGFVRSIGPQWSWYSVRHVPIRDRPS